MMWGGGCGTGAGGVIWIVVMLGVLALVVVGVVLLVRGPSGRRDYGQAEYPPGPPPGVQAPKSALQVLEERYARGDIDQEEFLRRKADLVSWRGWITLAPVAASSAGWITVLRIT